MEKLSDEEYRLMFQLLHRHSETEMDQWDLWKFESKFGKVYISLSRAPDPGASEDNWIDVTHMLSPK